MKPIEKKLDKMWSEKVRQDYCQWCGQVGPTDPHHIMGRVSKNTRWDPENGIALCRGCHNKVKTKEFKEFIGKEGYQKLKRKSNDLAHNIDYERIKNKLENYEETTGGETHCEGLPLH